MFHSNIPFQFKISDFKVGDFVFAKLMDKDEIYPFRVKKVRKKLLGEDYMVVYNEDLGYLILDKYSFGNWSHNRDLFVYFSVYKSYLEKMEEF